MTSKPPTGGDEAKQRANQEKRDAKHILTKIHELKALITQSQKHPEADGTPQNLEQERNRRPQWVIAAVTVIYAIAAIFQWLAMRDSNDINRKAFQSVQRPFVVFSPAPNILSLEVDPTTKEVTKYHLQLVVHNTGNTPTRGMTMHTNWRMKPIGQAFDYPDVSTAGIPCSILQAPGCEAVGLVLGPRDLVGGTDLTIGKETVEQFKTGNTHTTNVYFYGWASYQDVFDNTPRHRTEFCTELSYFDPVTKQIFVAACPKHNCTDEECPAD